MVTSQYNFIIQQMESLLSFLEPLLPFANSAMVNYFSKTLYKTCLKQEIRDEIFKLGEEQALKLIFDNKINTTTPHLYNFIQNSKTFSLCNCTDVCLNVDKLQNILQQWGCENVSGFKLEIFMNSKKSHEVEILSSIAAALRNVTNTTHLVDIGDGKGYLSSMLALHHKIPVLGVDASQINTNSAVKRLGRLQKIWKGISVSNKTSPSYEQYFSPDEELYKQLTMFVDEDVKFADIVGNVFPNDDKLKLGLVGLHTCGNLGPTSIKIFNTHNDIKTICNVSCCYHLLNEIYETNPYKVILNQRPGFPMSDFLKSKKYVLGRGARMLAAQSIDRILHNRTMTHSAVFYRAAFQIFLDKYSINTDKNVGKLRKECSSFVEYARKAIKKLDININVSDDELDCLYNVYKSKITEMNVYNVLRCFLAPVIEHLILLDRLLYLHENNYENAYLVQLFDPVISPRCYGLIAIKDVS